jgi:hypothetical protein
MSTSGEFVDAVFSNLATEMAPAQVIRHEHLMMILRVTCADLMAKMVVESARTAYVAA